MIRTVARMGTIVTIHVVERAGGEFSSSECSARIDRAFEWFRVVEESCTRFDAASEIMQATRRAGVATPISDLLFEVVRFALVVAGETHGAFDPTVGHAMERRGFDEDYRTRARISTPIDPSLPVSYRDVHLDAEHLTITIDTPLILDLGAVAKGFAIDLAARELRDLEHFAINAGGDLYLGGRNPDDGRWAVGIRHPRHDDAIVDTVHVSNAAVCTSGDYERRDADADLGGHILDPRTGNAVSDVASVTVIAPTAMAADALGTAAFVLGPTAGLALLDRHGVDGLILSPAIDRYETHGWRREHGE